MINVIHKLSNGIVLTLRISADNTRKPVVILCHGFCGIRDILLPSFAEAFTRAGFSTITFDYRGFGDSDGERGRLIPLMQINDIISVINWAKEHPSLNGKRIGLWGTSFGGCHVFGAAASVPGIKCVVSQLAFADGKEVLTGRMSTEEKENFIQTLDKMVDKKERAGKEVFVSVNRVLSDPESKLFFEGNRSHYPKMDIKTPFFTVREMLLYKPALNASKVRFQHLLSLPPMTPSTHQNRDAHCSTL